MEKKLSSVKDIENVEFPRYNYKTGSAWGEGGGSK